MQDRSVAWTVPRKERQLHPALPTRLCWHLSQPQLQMRLFFSENSRSLICGSGACPTALVRVGQQSWNHIPGSSVYLQRETLARDMPTWEWHFLLLWSCSVRVGPGCPGTHGDTLGPFLHPVPFPPPVPLARGYFPVSLPLLPHSQGFLAVMQGSFSSFQQVGWVLL